MLRISKLTDYSLVLLVALAESTEPWLSARQLAESTGLRLPTVTKLLKILTQHHFIHSVRGHQGGYGLKLDASHIQVRRVIEALEGPIALTECSSSELECEVQAFCQVRPRWQLINQVVLNALEGISLRDLIRGRGAE